MTDPACPARRAPGRSDLELASVWARYPGAAAAALRGIDLDLRPGPTGGGGRAERGGQVDPGRRAAALPGPRRRVGRPSTGHPSSTSTATTCARWSGWSGQDAHLFDTTLAENLRLGRRARDRRRAGARCSNGSGLAGWLAEAAAGPRHRGRAARDAACRAASASGWRWPGPCWPTSPCCVLDEPAEHLDPAAADALDRRPAGGHGGPTPLLITHRLTGLESVDEIVVLEDGRVVERGTHDALLAAGGRYSELWWEELRANVEDRRVERDRGRSCL